MLKIGLTGGIGSGKSTVARIFETLNVPVYYADAASKRLYDTNPQLIRSIKEQFGEDLYTSTGFDRKRMSEIVFRDASMLELLNTLVHPLTISDANQWMDRQVVPYVIKEAALIFESGSDKNLHYVIGVRSPESLRIERVMERDGLSRADVKQRIERQMAEEEKMARCQFIINNDEEQLIIPQVLVLHERLMSLSEGQTIE